MALFRKKSPNFWENKPQNGKSDVPDLEQERPSRLPSSYSTSLGFGIGAQVSKGDDSSSSNKAVTYPAVTTIPPPNAMSTPNMLSSTSKNWYGSHSSSTWPSISQQPTSNPSEDYQHPYGDKFPAKRLLTAIILPIIFMVIIAGVILCCLRRRHRKQRNLTYHERKPEEVLHTGTTLAESSSSDTRSSPPNLPFPAPARHQSAPMIVAPMIAPNNGAYFTGIDTSDVVSVTSTNPPAVGMDEPPPPYRPRSIVATALSRETSLRQPTGRPHSGLHEGVAPGLVQVPQVSPFEDPDESDEISEISEYIEEHPSKGVQAKT